MKKLQWNYSTTSTWSLRFDGRRNEAGFNGSLLALDLKFQVSHFKHVYLPGFQVVRSRQSANHSMHSIKPNQNDEPNRSSNKVNIFK